MDIGKVVLLAYQIDAVVLEGIQGLSSLAKLMMRQLGFNSSLATDTTGKTYYGYTLTSPETLFDLSYLQDLSTGFITLPEEFRDPIVDPDSFFYSQDIVECNTAFPFPSDMFFTHYFTISFGKCQASYDGIQGTALSTIANIQLENAGLEVATQRGRSDEQMEFFLPAS